MLQDYVRQLANTVLPQEHIWRHICATLCLPDLEHAELVTQGWRCLVGSSKRNVGEFSNSCVRSEADLIIRLYRTKNPQYGKLLLRQLLKDYGQTTVRMDTEALYVTHELADCLGHQRRYPEAEAFLEESLLKAAGSGCFSNALQANLLESLSVLQYSQGKHDMAGKNTRKAIDLSNKEHCPKDIRGIAWHTRLERWLREQGRRS
jgi:tetratricopeptide (TPR) repeat protein